MAANQRQRRRCHRGSPASLPGYATPGKIIVAPGATIGGRVGGTGFTEADIATLAANATIPATAYLGISTQNGNYTYSTAIGGNYGLAKLEGNTLTIDKANTYTGGTLITEGFCNSGAAETTGDLSTGPISIAAGGALAFNRSDAYTPNVGNLITGDGAPDAGEYNGSLAPAFDNQFNMTGTLTFGNSANSATSGNLNLTNKQRNVRRIALANESRNGQHDHDRPGKTLTINGNVDMTNTVNNATNLVTMTVAEPWSSTARRCSSAATTGAPSNDRCLDGSLGARLVNATLTATW